MMEWVRYLKAGKTVTDDKLFAAGLIVVWAVTFFGSVSVGSLLFCCWLVPFRRVTWGAFLFLPFLLSVMAFTLYSTPEVGDYDIVRYYTYYHNLARMTPDTALLYIGLRGDWLFYSITYLIARLFPADPRMMGFVFTFVTSAVLLRTYRNIACYLQAAGSISRADRIWQLCLWMICFVSVINIPCLTNIYRQNFASALMLWGFSRTLNGRAGWPLYLAAVFSHWSSMMFVLPLWLVRKRVSLYYWAIPFAFCLGASGLLAPVLQQFGESATRYSTGEELGVDHTLIVVDLLVVFAMVWVVRLCDKAGRLRALTLLLATYAVLFFRMSTVTTRLYYTVSFAVTTILPLTDAACQSVVRKRNLSVLTGAIVALTLFYNLKNIMMSHFVYQLFSEGWYLRSVWSILQTPFPQEMIG